MDLRFLVRNVVVSWAKMAQDMLAAVVTVMGINMAAVAAAAISKKRYV
ncbi:MAG: hypothetical protein H6Q68_1439 [Firmicutes bacterium]|nr:hypothetical protein [Bacillota bacterium]